jgi:hypothetical protein
MARGPGWHSVAFDRRRLRLLGGQARLGSSAFAKLPEGTQVPKVVEPMPAAKAKPRPAAKKAAAAKRPAAKKAASAAKRPAARSQPKDKNPVQLSAELSEDVLQSLEDGAKAAIEAVRKFVETVDEALPLHGDGPSKREEITDSALEMAQRLVTTQYDFLRKVVDSATKALPGGDGRK